MAAPPKKKDQNKRKPICKTGLFSFLSTSMIILTSLGAFNYYLKHQTSLIALTVKVEMCKLEFDENMCDREGGPLPALVAQCRGWEDCMKKDPHEYLHTDSEMMRSFNASMD